MSIKMTKKMKEEMFSISPSFDNVDWNNKGQVFRLMGHNGDNLGYASEKWRNDKEVVLLAVNQDGLALQYASEELRHDKEVCLAALEQEGESLRFMPIEIQAEVAKRNPDNPAQALRTMIAEEHLSQIRLPSQQQQQTQRKTISL